MTFPKILARPITAAFLGPLLVVLIIAIAQCIVWLVQQGRPDEAAKFLQDSAVSVILLWILFLVPQMIVASMLFRSKSLKTWPKIRQIFGYALLTGVILWCLLWAYDQVAVFPSFHHYFGSGGNAEDPTFNSLFLLLNLFQGIPILSILFVPSLDLPILLEIWMAFLVVPIYLFVASWFFLRLKEHRIQQKRA